MIVKTNFKTRSKLLKAMISNIIITSFVVYHKKELKESNKRLVLFLKNIAPLKSVK